MKTSKMKASKMKVWNEFKEFALKGSAIDLAVGIIVGAAFGKIVTSLVNDIIMPVLGIILGSINLRELKLLIRPAVGNAAELSLYYGSFFQNIIDFLTVAFSIFLFIKLINAFRRKKETAAEKPVELTVPPVPSKEELLLTEIRDLLKQKQI